MVQFVCLEPLILTVGISTDVTNIGLISRVIGQMRHHMTLRQETLVTGWVGAHKRALSSLEN
jgi:hypothetical protein